MKYSTFLTALSSAFLTIFVLFASDATALTLFEFEGNASASAVGVGASDVNAVSDLSSMKESLVVYTETTQASFPTGTTSASTSGVASMSSQVGVEGIVIFEADGDQTFGINATNGGGIDMTEDLDGQPLDFILTNVLYDFANSLTTSLTVRFYSCSATALEYSSHTYLLDRLIAVPENITIPATDFTDHGPLGAADWTNICAAQILIDGSQAADLIVDDIITNGRCPQVPNFAGNQVINECNNCTTPGTLGDLSCLDCSGTPFGNLVPDACGVCNGNNACIDCNGSAFGGAEPNACGICTPPGESGDLSCLDCEGVPFGSATLDSCGVCGGDGTSCFCTESSFFSVQAEADGSLAAIRDICTDTVLRIRTLQNRINTTFISNRRLARVQTNCEENYEESWQSLFLELPSSDFDCGEIAQRSCAAFQTNTVFGPITEANQRSNRSLARAIRRVRRRARRAGVRIGRSIRNATDSAQGSADLFVNIITENFGATINTCSGDVNLFE